MFSGADTGRHAKLQKELRKASLKLAPLVLAMLLRQVCQAEYSIS